MADQRPLWCNLQLSHCCLVKDWRIVGSRSDAYEMGIREIMRVRGVSRDKAEEIYKQAFLEWLLKGIAEGATLVGLTLEERIQIESGQGDQLLKEIAEDPRRDELARRLAEAELKRKG